MASQVLRENTFQMYESRHKSISPEHDSFTIWNTPYDHVIFTLIHVEAFSNRLKLY